MFHIIRAFRVVGALHRLRRVLPESMPAAHTAPPAQPKVHQGYRRALRRVSGRSRGRQPCAHSRLYRGRRLSRAKRWRGGDGRCVRYHLTESMTACFRQNCCRTARLVPSRRYTKAGARFESVGARRRAWSDRLAERRLPQRRRTFFFPQTENLNGF